MQFTIKMKVQSTFYPDFISENVDLLIINSFIIKNAQIIDIWCIYAVNVREKNVANYALLWCKIFSLKIWQCKILNKYHICLLCSITTDIVVQIQHKPRRSLSYILPCVVAAFIINIPRWGEGPAGWTDHDNDDQTRRNFDSFFGNKYLFFCIYWECLDYEKGFLADSGSPMINKNHFCFENYVNVLIWKMFCFAD